MITRRHFLAALSALPFVGKLVPQDVAITRGPANVLSGWDLGKHESYTVYSLVDKNGICASFDFDRQQWDIYREPNSDLSNLEGVVTQQTMTTAEFNRRYPTQTYFVPDNPSA